MFAEVLVFLLLLSLIFALVLIYFEQTRNEMPCYDRAAIQRELVNLVGQGAYDRWRAKMQSLLEQEGIFYHGMVGV